MTDEQRRVGAMTGPQHFAEAERLLETETEVDWQGDPSNDLALAQCRATEAVGHALLAVAAATYEGTKSAGNANDWLAVLTAGEKGRLRE